MDALVLSGAANFGAMQAGALEPLFASGYRPDMIVGTSAGALNGVYLALDPTLEGVQRLQEIWTKAGPREVGVPKPIAAVRRLVGGHDSLVDSDRLREFLTAHMPAEIKTFGELRAQSGVRAFAVAVGVDSGRMRVFGDREDDRLLDGMLASSAVPPYFPPWPVEGERYMDGGIYAKLPLCAALQRGATRLVALDVADAMGTASTAHGVWGISGYALSLMVEAQTAAQIAWARRTGAQVRVLRLPAPSEVTFWDYDHAERLIDLGRAKVADALEAHPLRAQPRWWVRLRMQVRGGDRTCFRPESPS